jgi:predicted RNA-binding protein with PUA-like domain
LPAPGAGHTLPRPVPSTDHPRTPMACWLLKSEPSVYSIEDLRRDGRTTWEGVRNYQARNFLRDTIREGDRVLFQHSNAAPPAVAGIAEVVRAGYPDATALDPASPYHDPKATVEDPRWYRIDVGFVEAFATPVPLDRLREARGLEGMPLLNRSRLSVQPVTDAEFEIIARLGRG